MPVIIAMPSQKRNSSICVIYRVNLFNKCNIPERSHIFTLFIKLSAQLQRQAILYKFDSKLGNKHAG